MLVITHKKNTNTNRTNVIDFMEIWPLLFIGDNYGQWTLTVTIASKPFTGIAFVFQKFMVPFDCLWYVSVLIALL